MRVLNLVHGVCFCIRVDHVLRSIVTYAIISFSWSPVWFYGGHFSIWVNITSRIPDKYPGAQQNPVTILSCVHKLVTVTVRSMNSKVSPNSKGSIARKSGVESFLSFGDHFWVDISSAVPKLLDCWLSSMFISQTNFFLLKSCPQLRILDSWNADDFCTWNRSFERALNVNMFWVVWLKGELSFRKVTLG